MAESITTLDGADAEPGSDAAREGKARRFRTLIIAAAAASLLAAGASIAYVTGALDGVVGSEPAQDTAADGATAQPAPIVFYELPDLVVSLNTNERQSTFLKVKISLELPDQAAVAAVERVMPRIIDHCQVYLRELRPDDLRGSAGTLRLRQELRRRIAIAIAPAEIRDVLFVDLLVQ
ncbi:MAG: flagellar basal body-associated FliL family protein [Rhodospirillales bacterium]